MPATQNGNFIYKAVSSVLIYKCYARQPNAVFALFMSAFSFYGKYYSAPQSSSLLPLKTVSKAAYVTSGPSLVVQFSSSLGSLDGSSINYGFDVRVAAQSDQDINDILRSCSKVITPQPLTSGSVSFQYEDFKNALSHVNDDASSTGSSHSMIFCNLTFDATTIVKGKVNVSIYSPFSIANCNKCDQSDAAKIIVYREFNGPQPLASSQLCLCKMLPSDVINYVVSTVLSIGANMIVALQLPPNWGLQHQSTIEVSYAIYSTYLTFLLLSKYMAK